ncbi:MAG: hypothetical protein HC915_06815 [Anaerolineae bacterium]|nr:hypothetical protein [Anaerolineae bacterium]
MQLSDIQLGFVAIARPTFDVPLAEETAQRAYAQLQTAGYQVYGSPGLVMSLDDLTASLATLQAQPLDLLVVMQASFADSSMVVQLGNALDCPLLLWGVPEERTGGRLRLNSFCGINLAAHGLRRAGLRYEFVYAPPDEASALATLAPLAQAGAARRRLRQARVGQVGDAPAGFDTCRYDAAALRQQLGVEVVKVDLHHVFERVRAIPQAETAALADRLGEQVSGLEALEQEPTRAPWAPSSPWKRWPKPKNWMAWRCVAGQSSSRTWAAPLAEHSPCSVTSKHHAVVKRMSTAPSPSLFCRRLAEPPLLAPTWSILMRKPISWCSGIVARPPWRWPTPPSNPARPFIPIAASRSCSSSRSNRGV